MSPGALRTFIVLFRSPWACILLKGKDIRKGNVRRINMACETLYYWVIEELKCKLQSHCVPMLKGPELPTTLLFFWPPDLIPGQSRDRKPNIWTTRLGLPHYLWTHSIPLYQWHPTCRNTLLEVGAKENRPYAAPELYSIMFTVIAPLLLNKSLVILACSYKIVYTRWHGSTTYTHAPFPRLRGWQGTSPSRSPRWW